MSDEFVVETYFMTTESIALESVWANEKIGHYEIVSGHENLAGVAGRCFCSTQMTRIGPTGLLVCTSSGEYVNARRGAHLPIMLEIKRPAWAPRPSDFFAGLICLDLDTHMTDEDTHTLSSNV